MKRLRWYAVAPYTLCFVGAVVADIIAIDPARWRFLAIAWIWVSAAVIGSAIEGHSISLKPDADPLDEPALDGQLRRHDWEPIATAPKGREILVDSGDGCPVSAMWVEDRWAREPFGHRPGWVTTMDGREIRPTRWLRSS